MADTWIEKQWDETDPRPRSEILAALKAAMAERDEARENEDDGLAWGALKGCQAKLKAADARAAALEEQNRALRTALTNIAEGNLGEAAWQANYDKIREVAIRALGSQDGEAK